MIINGRKMYYLYAEDESYLAWTISNGGCNPKTPEIERRGAKIYLDQDKYNINLLKEYTFKMSEDKLGFDREIAYLSAALAKYAEENS